MPRTLISLALLFSRCLLAQSPSEIKTPFTYSDLLQLSSAQDVAISADGSQILYSVSSINAAKDGTVKSWFAYTVATGKPMQISLPSVSAACWSFRAGQIAVVGGGPDGTARVTLLESKNLRPTRTFELPGPPEAVAWSPDDTTLAFTMFVPTVSDASFLQRAVTAVEKTITPALAGDGAFPVLLTESARYRLDGGSWPAPGHYHIFVMSVTTGALRQLDQGPYDDADIRWSSDGKSVLFDSDRRSVTPHAARVPSIYQVDVATGAVNQITHGEGSCTAPVESPDGKWIVFTEAPFRAVNYTETLLRVMRPDGTELRTVGEKLDRDIFSPHWSPDSRSMYALYEDHGVAHIALLGLDGSIQPLVTGTMEDFSVSRRGDIAYAADAFNSPKELWLEGSDSRPRRLTDLNRFLRDRQLGRLVEIKGTSSADSTPIQGWVLLPFGASDRDKLPLIVTLHGGPFGSDGPGWSRANQLYAAAGYAVLYVNYRGSTSYGAAFSEPANHNFPGLAYDDVMSLVDEVVHRELADPHRLFLTGGSAGGQLTAWATGKTDRFRAAVAEKPVINVLSDALTSDQYLASPMFSEGDPWTRVDQLWTQSPLSLASNMHTPLLLIVGEEDYRTPLEESLQLYDALMIEGVPVALLRVPGAGHENLASRPSQFIAETTALLAWFAHYDVGSR